MSSDPWDAILDKNEEILWQGRPDAGGTFSKLNFREVGFGIVVVLFSVFWMAMAAQAGGSFWTFGLIFFFLGLYQTVGRIYWEAYQRSYTFYTLTDRRAIIATDLPLIGKRLNSYPITQDTVLEFELGPPDTIIFSKHYRQTQRGSFATEIGFERIANGHDVYRLMRQIQSKDMA